MYSVIARIVYYYEGYKETLEDGGDVDAQIFSEPEFIELENYLNFKNPVNSLIRQIRVQGNEILLILKF